MRAMGPCFHLAGRVALGVDVGDLLQLERALERDRVVDAAPQVEEVRGPVEALGDLPDDRIGPEHVLHQDRELRQRLDDAARLAVRQRAARLPEAQGQQVERDELRRERLGRRHPDLGAGVGVDGAVGLAGGHAPDDVADGDAPGAPGAGLAQRGQRVGGLAGLRDRHGQGARADQRLAVAELRGVVDVHADAGQRLDEELADQAGVPRRAAGQDPHLVDRAQRRVRHLQLAQVDAGVLGRDPSEHRLLERAGLLEDLFQHEVLVAGLLGHHRIPEDALRGLGDRPPGEVGEGDAAARDDRHLGVPEEDDVAGVAEDGRHVGGHQELALADPDDERRAVARRHHLARVGRVHEDHPEQAPELAEHPAHRALEPVAVGPELLLHEVRDHLRVGLGLEAVAGPAAAAA